MFFSNLHFEQKNQHAQLNTDRGKARKKGKDHNTILERGFTKVKYTKEVQKLREKLKNQERFYAKKTITSFKNHQGKYGM